LLIPAALLRAWRATVAFTGYSTHAAFTAGPLNAEDVSSTIALLAPDETPLLDWLGDSDVFATNTVHEFLEEELRPNYLTNSTAIASATAATGIQLADFGDLLTVGTVIDLEVAGSTSERMQVTSVVGANSVLVSRNFGASGTSSLAAGGSLFVSGNFALEGQDHPGSDVTRKRRRKTTYVGLFHVPIAISGTQLSVQALGNGGNELQRQSSLRIREALRDLEKEVVRGYRATSIGSDTTYRTFNGLQRTITGINSSVVYASFNANPHLYLGDVWEQAYKNGASETEEWGVIAGRSYFRSISNMNDTKVEDSNQSESFKRVIRNYEGPFGRCQVFLSRWIHPEAAIIVPRQRVKVTPLQGRAFQILDIAKTGDSEKRLLVGEYTVEIHHSQAMAQLHT
jgi:hypothetical protein